MDPVRLESGTARARRVSALLLCGVLLSLSSPSTRQEKRLLAQGSQLHTRQLAQVDLDGGGGQAVAAASLAPPPQNVTGTYRGSWRKQQFDAAFGSSFPSQESGMAVFKLTSHASLRPGVHTIMGELVLRDGVYASEADVLLQLQGVYVVDVGRLKGVLEPSAPVTQPFSAGSQNLPGYRTALRQAAANWLATAGRGGGDGGAALSSASRSCQFSFDFAVRQTNHTQQDGGGSSKDGMGSWLMSTPPSAQGSRAGEDALVNGSVSSSNCGMVLALNASTTHIEAYYAKAVNYTVMITLLAFVQIMLLVRQMEASSTQALASKVSLLTIGQQAVLDAYLCLLHLTVGIMVEPLFNAFATAAFFEFTTFAILEMRFLLSVWRARRPGGSMDPWTAQRELSILYGRFYGALLGGILLSYYLQRFMKAAVFLLYSFWIPQIVLCVRTDCRQPLRAAYVVGMSLCRLALPLYLYGCPRNLLRVAPSPGVCVGLVLFVGLQAAVLLAQERWGPRCFIPKRFLPPKYDYFRPTPRGKGRPGHDIESGEGGAECVICMNPVDVDSAAQRMITPCNHFFHPQCLERWMNVKAECPTCRRQLPPL